MKKLLTTTCLVIGLILTTHINSFAQEGQFQAGATYGFTEEISGAADVIFFFPENIDWFEFNANGHYKFLAEEGMSVYGLAGLNYVSISVDIPSFNGSGGGSVSNSEIGLNLGGGAEFDVDFANIYGELKYVLSNADQLVLSAGLRFPI